MKNSEVKPTIALMYLGAFAPEQSEYKNGATSTAGDLFQMNFLTALAGSTMPTPTVHAYFPVPSFPKSKKLFFGNKSIQLKNGLKVNSLSHFNLGALKIATLGLSAAIRTFTWAIKNRKADRRVVICYNLTAPPAWPIWLVSKIIQLDVVPFIGDIYVPGEVVKDTLLRRIEFNGQKRLIPKVDGLLIANQAIVEDFAPNSHSLLLEGGVMESLVRRFEANPRSEDNTFHVVYAGQLSVLNGVTMLLDALKILEMPNLKVTILGAGEFAEVVRKAAQADNRINYLGLRDHEEVLKAYEQADLLVNLRRTDYQTHRYVFPSKVVECLATGRPLLTTCTGHVENEFADLVYMLRDENPQALAKMIKELASMAKHERESVGVRAKNYVLKNKTWEGHILRLENYLNESVFSKENTLKTLNQKKTKVLTVVDYYLPGYKGGGPAVSVSRIIGCLNGEIDFSVFTRDRDLGDTKPYAKVKVNTWCDKDGVHKFYASPERLNIFGLWSAVRHVKPDVIYLNSYFSKLTRSILFLRSIGVLRKIPVLVAPRGEFSPGALQLKNLKKKHYLAFANLLKFHSGITWQVSSIHELNDARAVVHTNAEYFIKAPDIIDRASSEPITSRAQKLAGSADFAFISRISPKKNLLSAIEMLRTIRGDVTFAIYGPIEDQAYWSKCADAIESLPMNIRCEIKGGIPSHEVLDKLSEHHFFLFPTLGENFGHVIPEALAAGCPVLLSDQTPWQDLSEKGVGWVIPLSEEKLWLNAIQSCIDMDGESFEKMSIASKAYIAKLSQSTSDIDLNRDLFTSTILNQSKWAA